MQDLFYRHQTQSAHVTEDHTVHVHQNDYSWISPGFHLHQISDHDDHLASVFQEEVGWLVVHQTAIYHFVTFVGHSWKWSQ